MKNGRDDIRDYFETSIDTREGFRANCPRCDDHEKKFYWNTEKGAGCCFHAGCPWFYQTSGVYEARLRAFFGDRPKYTAPKRIVASDTADVSLPDEFLTLPELDEATFTEVYYYLKSRGITQRAMETAMLGYCKKGEHWGYVIIPVFANGEVVYWQGRRFKHRQQKFYNPKSSRKAEILYEMASVTDPESILLVESAFNALTLDDGQGKSSTKIFALLGSTLSEEQLSKILMYERYAKDIIVALDPDAWKKAVDMAKRLSGIVPAVRLAQFQPHTDINLIGRENAWGRINRALLYEPKRHVEMTMLRS